ncbi:GNAT family N-acetyltransferase [Blautia sp. An249]|uniref:GNAT family N-acetyltransferase n=1 Tax=Blautia sp. An249 TaxID=1965603 RepID=UPI000B3969D0|nr:GNAT family N-acetyltransferase [Blautia sp. An249]OUO79395.1 GNAT family N-acetyltransferase [Blautia sp. An249]
MLKTYTIEQAMEWDKVVRSFNEYDTYWLSGYSKGFQIHGDGEPLLFYYEGKHLRGINVVMKRDIAKSEMFRGKFSENILFDICTPYGYGGWLIEGENKELLFDEYDNWCKNHRIVSEFVRFHPVLQNHRFNVDAYDVCPLGNTVVMDLSSPYVIWTNIISKCKNKIRKAKKNGVQIYSGRYPEIYKEFRFIYNSTMDKDHADKYYYFEEPFYESILNDLPQNAQIFYAVYDGTIIAASIILISNGRMNYHLSGSLSEYARLAPVNLLLYEAALWGCEHGCKTLYLGGGVGSDEDSLYKFKKSFNRLDNDNKFYIGKKIFLRDKYDQLLEMRGETNSSFFPKYRA